MIFISLIKKEMSILIPQLKNAEGDVVTDTPFDWMVTKPDGHNDWSTWLNLWLDSILMYDAGALYKEKIGGAAYKINYEGTAERIKSIKGLKKGEDIFVHNHAGRTVHLRVIDGSTIFPVINENGSLPQAPFPAYVQVIKGTPYEWLTRDQLWYQPRFMRSNAPYGIAPVEDCAQAIQVLSNYWDWVAAWYTFGTRADDYMRAPSGWTEEQVLKWQEARALLLAGNPEARQQMQFMPYGFEAMSTGGSGAGVSQAREGDYKRSYEKVSLAFGIPPSERGDAPEQGFGGQSWHEGGTNVFGRQVLLSLMNYCALPFNEILRDEYGYTKDEMRFELSFPAATISPEQEEQKTLDRWEKRIITRNETRQNINLPAREGPDGSEYFEPSAAMPAQEAGETATDAQEDSQEIGYNWRGGGSNGNGANGNSDSKIRVIKYNKENGHLPVWLDDSVRFELSKPKRLTKAQRQFFLNTGVEPKDDNYFGAPVSREVKVPYPEFTSNELEIVSIDDNTLGARAAIWRGEDGESEGQREVVGGPLYPRDEAVYLLDRAMELYLVPLAYVTELDGEQGCIVHYVRGNDAAKDIEDYAPEWLDRAGLLDYISGQMDRHSGNWLTHPKDKKRPILIDNGMSFGDTFKPDSPFVEYLASKPLSEEIQDLLYLVVNNHALWDDIAELAGDENAQAALERARQLLPVEETEAGKSGLIPALPQSGK